jgi:hypothetical protein
MKKELEFLTDLNKIIIRCWQIAYISREKGEKEINEKALDAALMAGNLSRMYERGEVSHYPIHEIDTGNEYNDDKQDSQGWDGRINAK